MAQNSFAFLFLLVLGAGAVSLLWSIRESWTQVWSALAGEMPRDIAPQAYTTTLRPAAEVSWVAQRLVLRELDEALPETPAAFATWALPQPARRSPGQLAFAFAGAAKA